MSSLAQESTVHVSSDRHETAALPSTPKITDLVRLEAEFSKLKVRVENSHAAIENVKQVLEQHPEEAEQVYTGGDMNFQ